MARIALIFAYGPESRSFLHSGLASALASRHRLTIFATNPASSSLLDVPAEVEALPEVAECRSMARIRNFTRKSSRTSLAHPTSHAERLAARAIGGSPLWADMFRKHRIDAVLAPSYNSARTLPALATAARMGIPSTVIANSWKDTLAQPHLPVFPTRLGVFDSIDATAVAAANPDFPSERIAVCGSLHLGSLAMTPAMNRGVFCRTVGLDPARPIVCMSLDRRGTNDEQLALQLRAAFDYLPKRPQLLVRTNPMGRPLETPGGACVLKPVWEWSPEMDWCCPLREDNPLWRSAIEHSAANVSAPSTVTLEFAAFGRPVINICFGEGRDEAWNSPFYSRARQNWATSAFSFAELVAAIRRSSGAQPKLPLADSTRLVEQLVEASLENPGVGKAAALQSCAS